MAGSTTTTIARNPCRTNLVEKYRTLGDLIYQREIELFGKKSKNNSAADDRWVESTMRKGTLKDRIAAMSVTVSSNPVHKLYALDGLLQMTGCSAETGHKPTNSRVAQLAAEAVEDLFLTVLLPPNRKLVPLNHRPLYLYEPNNHSRNGNNNKGSSSRQSLSPRVLLLWRLEEMIQEKYELFLDQYMTYTLREGMEVNKVSCLRTASSLLRGVPQGESQLLSMMVNKIGDPLKKIASTAANELRRVLRQHPNMQMVVAREVQQLAHRPHLSSKALYNCVIFLNQLKLKTQPEEEEKGEKKEEEEEDTDASSLPASLINTYFRLFELTVKDPLSNRSGIDDGAMKSRLLSALLAGVNRAHPYLPKKDQHMEKHVGALYKVVHTSPPATSTQALLLLFHLAVGSQQGTNTTKPPPPSSPSTPSSSSLPLTEVEISRQERFYRALYSTLSTPSFLSSGKHLTMFYNLLYKAMKYDTDTTRVIAFAKRIMCTAIHSSGASLAASIFLLNEISTHHPLLHKYLITEQQQEDTQQVMFDATKREPRASFIPLNKNRDKDATKKDDDSNNDNPANDDNVQQEDCANCALSWELSLTSHHFHPSVSKFSTSVGNIHYGGDPLRDFSLMPFLDKFVYRNPKSVEKLAQRYKRGDSIAERRTDGYSILESQASLPFNDPSFLQKKDVHEQDVFFHQFFVERARRDKMKGIVRGKQLKEDMNEEDEEELALDDNEAKIVDETFEAYEGQWETDSEEEAFVDALGQKLLQESAGGAPADLDDEDVDMDDWGDMYNNDNDDDDDDDDDDDNKDNTGLDSDEDDGGREEQSDSDIDEDNNDIDDEYFLNKQDDDDDDAFMDDDGGSSSDDEIIEEDDSDDDDGGSSSKPKKKKKKIIHSAGTTFADASDYEKLINDAWDKRQKQIPVHDDHSKKESSTTSPQKKKGSSVKKNKKKRHRD